MKFPLFLRQRKYEKCLTSHIRRAYRLIGSATPISADCGQLCGAACCKAPEGAEAEYGMLLFPGEELLLKGDAHFTLSQLPPPKGFSKKVWFAACDGFCDRKKRPLACRIFPCLPYIPPQSRGNRNAYPAVIRDPRAGIVCPLVAHNANHIEEKFYAAVSRAAASLLSCREHRRFLLALSALSDYYLRFLY